MNYEEMKYGDENPYRAGKNGYLTEAEENDDIAKYDEWEFLQAIQVIEEANAIVKNENEYADLVAANSSIVEYREIILKYESSHNNRLLEEIQTLKDTIINLSIGLSKVIEKTPPSKKKLITVKEFEELYSIGEEAQRKLRKRMKDPLPFVQIVERGNVLYDCEEIGKWIENYKQ